MRVLIIGSGSGIPVIGHFNESVLMEVNESSYLFDAGEPCAAMMHTNALMNYYGVSQPVGAPVTDIYTIKSIFISHFDADHVGGLPMLLQVMHLWQARGDTFRFNPENKLRLYLPEENIGLFKDLLCALHLTKLRYALEILPIKEGEFFVDGTARVTAFRNTHIRDGHSFSFALQAEGKRVIYSGDLGNETEVFPLLDDKTDLAIVECAHFSPERLFQSLKRREKAICKLVINHIHPSLYGHEEEIVSLSKKYLNCEVLVGKDGLEILI